MAKDSTIVVRAKATVEHEFEKIGVIEFTVTTVEVVESYRGSKPGTQLKIRQEGSPEMEVSDDFIATLKPNTEYLIYLKPLVINKQTTGKFIVTGAGAGAFVANGNGKATKMDEVSTDLPNEISESSVTKSLNK